MKPEIKIGKLTIGITKIKNVTAFILTVVVALASYTGKLDLGDAVISIILLMIYENTSSQKSTFISGEDIKLK